MTNTIDFGLSRLLEAQEDELLRVWMTEVLGKWKRDYPHPADEDHLRLQSKQLLEEIRKLFAGSPGESWEPAPDSRITTLLHGIFIHRAKQGLKPADSVLYLVALKRILLRALLQNHTAENTAAFDALLVLENLFDRLNLLVYETYVDTRERTIAQQSLSLLELSTPVVRLWDRILMVPLIGVLDTLRARETTERLLEAFARFEATVAILDVTGVPVLDTSVAGHLMKTIAAAQMLGARVVMTGINPDGAQTMIKLGVNFTDVITRATLRAGIAESLLLIGKRIVAVRDTP